MAGHDGISCKTIARHQGTDRKYLGKYHDLSFRELRIPEQLVPSRLVLLPHSTLPLDVVAYGPNFCLNTIVKSVIECIAPGQAEFIPFDIELLDGTIKQYYFMNVLQHIACLCWNMGNVIDRGRSPNGMRLVGLPPTWGDPLDVRINRDAHNGVHIWHEEDAGKISSWTFISDELGQAFKESGATGIMLTPVKEIDFSSMGETRSFVRKR